MKNCKTSTAVAALAATAFLSLGASNCDQGGVSKTVELAILHTNDIHSHLDAASPGSEDNPFRLGGLARLKTVIDRERAKHPNSLLLDAGDWSEGSVFYTVDAGRNMLRLMDAMGYDAAVVGNHDFLNGPSEIANRMIDAKPRFEMLAANKNLSSLPPAEAARIQRHVPDYSIHTVAGVRVALIGLTTVATEFQSYFLPGRITDHIQTATRIATEIHDRKLADIAIVVSHNHLSDNLKLARSVPYIHMVVSGHDHAVTPQPLVVQNASAPVYVVEAGEWGKYLGEMLFTVDVEKRALKYEEYRLIPITEGTAENAGIRSAVLEEMRKLSTRFGHDIFSDRVGDCADGMPLSRSRANTAVGTILAESYRRAIDADVGVELADLVASGIPPGPLSTRNLFNVVPYIFSAIPGKPFPQFGAPWTVHKVTMSGSELFTLLDVAATAPALNLTGWISVAGARLSFASDSKTGSLRELKVRDGVTNQYEDVHGNRSYTVALHDGLLRALNLLDFSYPNTVDTGINTWEALQRLVRAKGTVLPQEFNPSEIFVPQAGDIAIEPHNIRFERTESGYDIRARFTNSGMKSTAQLRFSVQRSARPNDPLGERDLTRFVAVGEDAPIPPLPPGESVEVSVPWSPGTGPGVYTFLYSIIGSDAISANNRLDAHFRVP